MKDVLKYFEEISDPKSGIDRYGHGDKVIWHKGYSVKGD